MHEVALTAGKVFAVISVLGLAVKTAEEPMLQGAPEVACD